MHFEDIIMNKKLAEYMVLCVDKFAKEKNISVHKAFDYLNLFKGIDYLQEFYDIEYTLSLEDTIEALTLVCKNNGGNLQ
jgi:hypothetical protein